MTYPFFETYIAIDFETASNKRNSACQLGMVLVHNNEIIAQRNYLIQPPDNYYTLMTMSIHGITPDMTRLQPHFDFYWPHIREWVNRYPIVCHNKSFDISVLEHTCRHYGIDDLSIVDTHCTYQLTKLKLTEACRSLHIPIGKHHDGLADAVMCAHIYNKLRAGEKPNNQALLQHQAQLNQQRQAIYNTPIAAETSFFLGKSTLVTGIFEHFSRTEILGVLAQRGAIVKSAISNRLEIVVVGRNPGPRKIARLKAMAEAGKPIRIVNEAELLTLLAQS